MTLNLHARKSIVGPAIAGTISAAATRHVIPIALPIGPTSPKAAQTEIARVVVLERPDETSAQTMPQDYFLGKTDPLAGLPRENVR